MALVYLLSDDLMFTSRVSATAHALGLNVSTVRSQQQLINMTAAGAPKCLLVDLHNPGLAIGELVKSLAQPRPFVVAYGSHVDAAALQAARDAGCDLVLPRSKFTETLEKSLPAWCGVLQGPESPPNNGR